MSELLGGMVSELRGSYPDVPFAPGVDAEGIREDDANPMFVTLPLVKVGGVFLAMKSVESDPELQEARSAIAQLGGAVEDVTDYTIPGTEVTHRVVRIRKERPTPAGFPRAFARIKKAPLR